MNLIENTAGRAASHAPATRRPPVTRGLPVVGLLPELLLDPVRVFERAAREHPGAVVELAMKAARIYLVTRPAQVQHVLQDNARNYSKGNMWKVLRPLVGNGLATSDGETWLANRRLLQPLFGPRQITGLAELMVSVVDEEMDRFVELADRGAPVDMDHEMIVLAQRVVLRTMFGANLGRRESDALGHAIDAALKVVGSRFFLFFMPEFLPLPGDRALRESVELVDEALLRMVRERRQSGEERSDLLSRLIHARDEVTRTGMDDQQLRDELVTMFAAGNETTANTLTWTWYLLDRHPEVARRLRAEVDAVLGDRRPTFEDLAKLTYTKQVLQEAMRVYPASWIIPRTANGDDVIDGYAVKAGSILLVSPVVIHRDPALWKQPEVFDPDRFAPERAAARPRYAYMPFGGGPRQCIGNHFSMMEAQIILAMMARKVRPRLVPGHVVRPLAAVTFRPKDPLRMTLERAAPAAS